MPTPVGGGNAGRAHRALEHLGIALVYFLLAVVLTYPVVLAPRQWIPMDPQIQGWFPGDGDPWQYLWGFWYVARAFSTFPPPLLWTDLVFFPIGFDIPFLPGVGLVLGPAALLQSALGVVLTYNVLWWFSFALAGSAMYLFARHLGTERVVAFVCGGLFTFSTYRLIHSVEHLPILLASFLVPLFALTLLQAGRQPTIGRHVLCALVLAASTGISWYCTITLLLYLGLAVLLVAWQYGVGASVRVVPALVGLVVFVLAASPFALPLILSPARDSIVNRPLTDASQLSADLLAFFVPSPRNPLFGKLTGSLYERFTGNPYEQTVYLGYVLLALAALGLVTSARGKTRLFVVAGAVAFVLALGPFLHVAGHSRFAIEGETVSVPLPYLLLRYIPFVRGARVPSRFTELLVFALIVLAAYGLTKACARFSARGKVGFAAAVFAAALLETTLLPYPVASARAPAIYTEIGRSPDMSTVLELPLDWHIVKYHYYQTIHGKRMLIGHPVRPREKYETYPSGIPLISFLREPKLLLDRPDPAEARRDAARLAAFFQIRYVVIHGEYLDPPVFERLDRFIADNFPHASRHAEGTVVTYRLGPPPAPGGPLWPERYVIDFGDPRREFALLTGWGREEQWGDGTVQWSNDRESSLVVFLGAPVDRVLEVRLRPFDYPGSPPQTVSIAVNGTRRHTLVLDPAWAVYRIPVQASFFRRGLNTFTFTYGYAVEPARVIPGNADTRMLAVAFDYLALTPGQ
jgi:hypothetical protein